MRAALLLLVVLLTALATAGGAHAGPVAGLGVTRDVGPDYNGGKPLPFAADTAARARAARATPRRDGLAAVGDRQLWPALDDALGFVYLKNFTLRAVGERIEIWVASDADDVSANLAFPGGDCRNDERIVITDAQLQGMVTEFDGNIFPKESKAFSVPPERDGTFALVSDLGLPAGYWEGDGDNVVVLVDNIRDPSFYDFEANPTYVGGFFSSFFNELADRNVMTIDAFDWLHRTGASPPDEPDPDECESRPARPRLYESTFAHEYQHLLHYYEDPAETVWVDEGLSMYAEALTGYVDPARPITRSGFEGGLQCFLGWASVATPANPNPRAGGPENSLTAWGDQGRGDEILCDYGAVESFVHFLAGRYGRSFISDLHRDQAQGLDSVRGLLETVASPRDRHEIVHDWAAAVALDSLVDHGWQLAGGPPERYRVPSLDLLVNWDSEDAHSTPGAPPNGSDYVRLHNGDGSYLSGSQLLSIAFDGAQHLLPEPVAWAIDPAPPSRATNAAFSSGAGADLDRAMVREIAVPETNATLTFETRFATEPLFDYGFVQVSTDGGETYRSLANNLTTTEHDPGAPQVVLDNLPGLNGSSGGGSAPEWITTSFDLSEFAGQTILLSFRYLTDSTVEGGGWWIDNVRVGDRLIADGTALNGWLSPTAFDPIPIAGFTVQLVAYSTELPRWAVVHRLQLDAGFRGRLGGAALREVLDRDYDVVAAIVTYDEPTELLPAYAPYRLSFTAGAGG